MPPNVSIITVNYNHRAGLEKTVASVLAQTWPLLDYLVIDGGSTDGSAGIIQANKDRIGYWVSERDAGLYDAMNKGVKAAKGDWILFMNSDDVFVDDRVVADIFSQEHADADLVYGDVRRRYDDYGESRVFPAEPPTVLPWRMNCSHQSLFTRRSLLLAHPFGDGISSDYEFLLTCYSESRRFKHVDRLVSEVSAGGVSDANRLLSIGLRWRALSRLGMTSPRLALDYFYIALRGLAGHYGKRLLGRRLSAWVLRHRRI